MNAEEKQEQQTALMVAELEALIRECDESLDLYDGMYPVQRRLHYMLYLIECWREGIEVDE